MSKKKKKNQQQQQQQKLLYTTAILHPRLILFSNLDLVTDAYLQ